MVVDEQFPYKYGHLLIVVKQQNSVERIKTKASDSH